MAVAAAPVYEGTPPEQMGRGPAAARAAATSREASARPTMAPRGGSLHKAQDHFARGSVAAMTKVIAPESVTKPDDAVAGAVLSLLGFAASLYPGDLLVALPLLCAGLYVSVVGLRRAGLVAARRQLAIAGIALGVLGLASAAILFVIFIL
jgi:hypothetical protein